MTQATPTVMSEFEADVTVSHVEHVADDVVELHLAPATGTLPPWTPGAHIDLILAPAEPAGSASPAGPAGPELVRQYSLCGSPSDTSAYQVAVLRAPDSRGGSEAVHHLAEGTHLRIRGPRNHFPLVTAPRYVFIAGGIGITPMLPMIEEAEATGADWVLHYGGRSLGSMAFRERLEAYGDRVRLVPQDTDGILDLASILGSPEEHTLVYCCGPEPLLDAVEQRCATWPAHALHLERFSAKQREGDDVNTGFELVLQRSGVTVEVPPDQTVFDAMRAAGVSVLGSCLEGICGTCEQTVLEGDVDHRDSVLDEEEHAANESMMVCVSRCRGPRLVLDA